MSTWLIVILIMICYVGMGFGVALATIKWINVDVEDATMSVLFWPIVVFLMMLVLPVAGIESMLSKAKQKMDKERKTNGTKH